MLVFLKRPLASALQIAKWQGFPACRLQAGDSLRRRDDYAGGRLIFHRGKKKSDEARSEDKIESHLLNAAMAGCSLAAETLRSGISK